MNSDTILSILGPYRLWISHSVRKAVRDVRTIL